MKRVLVTGGAGFIGSNLVRKLITEYGCEVTVLDNMLTGRLENLQAKEIAREIEFIQGSILDNTLLKRVSQGKDAVFHLAAVTMLSAADKPRMDLETNIRGSFNVLEASLKAEVERVVYASTSSIYGNCQILPIDEGSGVQFLSFYSASKFAGESYAQVFFEQYQLPVTIVRYSNVYGYNQRPENPYTGVMAKFIQWALANKALLIHGDGTQTRDFTFIEDACRATILAATSAQALGQTYNIGTGQETSINELARLVLETTKSKSEILYKEKRVIDSIYRRVLNIEKMKSELKFTPEWSLRRGLKETVQWIEGEGK